MTAALITCARLAVAATMVLACSQAQAASLTSFWALGDSLSDPGNLYAATKNGPDPQPPSPPYYEGRFSNGPVWAEYVANDFKAEGLATGNFAYGGARAIPDGVDKIPDLPAQIGLFGANATGHLGTRPIASIWMGANDLIFNGVPAGNAADVGKAAAEAVAGGALALAGMGVRDLLLFNLPDLGNTPLYALSDDPLARAQATSGSLAFNSELAWQIPKLRMAGVNVIEIDMAGLFEDLLANPPAYGVANATFPCLAPEEPPCTAEQALLLAFFDPVHPNSVIHQEIAELVSAEIAAIPLPLPGVLLLIGIGAIGAVRRRV
jgi:outer membrane lipase/esterase